jgi:hypothetical protein
VSRGAKKNGVLRSRRQRASHADLAGEEHSRG